MKHVRERCVCISFLLVHSSQPWHLLQTPKSSRSQQLTWGEALKRARALAVWDFLANQSQLFAFSMLEAASHHHEACTSSYKCWSIFAETKQ